MSQQDGSAAVAGRRAPRDGENGDDTDGRYRLEEQAGYLLRRAHQRATAIFLAAFGDAQITPTQWAALVKLRDAGALSQNHLGRLTAMDPATVQGVIRRLARRGLIERRADAADRRRTVLTLSPEGRRLVAGLSARGRRVSETILAPLDARERRRLLELLRRLG